MSKTIEALDTFVDHRCGLMHKGQKANVSDPAANELEKSGLAKIVGDAKDEDTKPHVTEKAITSPENKMMKADKVSNKGKKD